MFKENNIEIPKHIAGLMISGILSDTLCLTSPTTTELDKEVVKSLSDVAEVDYEKYAIEMFKAGTSLKGKSISEIVSTDIKKFHNDDITFAIGQIFTLDYEEILKKKDDYVKEISKVNENKEYDFTILLVTDIIKNGSYILFTETAKTYLENAFDISNMEQGYYLEGLVSRKKQIVPQIMDVIL